MELTNTQNDIVKEEGHLLVEGGPGSGKTTVAIVKTEKIISQKLSKGQRILFLSFSRAAVSRVIEAIAESALMPREKSKLVEVETYHSFFWQIIKTHGYLLGLPRRINILTPVAQAVALSAIRITYNDELSEEEREKAYKQEREELKQLAFKEGQISFDLFAELAEQVLSSSTKVRKLVCTAFPFIFLDEFQDTNKGQWEIIKLLGSGSTLIALADPEQRIFDFIGADPERLNHFRLQFIPKEFSLASENHRSSGTDIAHFGNDVLSGKFRSTTYKGIEILKYPANTNQAFSALKIQTLQARKRLIGTKKKGWSLAVLVPTKKLMRMVSDNFREGTVSDIHHSAAIDMEGAILSAEIISFLLQPPNSQTGGSQFIDLICSFFQGKGGTAPTKTNLEEAQKIRNAYQKTVEAENLKKKKPKNIVFETLLTYSEIGSFKFTGNPEEDWVKVRSALQKSKCTRLQKVGEEAKNIRLLDRGTQLRDALALNWRESSCYSEALSITKQAFIQEHFSTSSKPETGVIVMNMHKAKGKQFDEVIIFEGWPKRVRGIIVSNTDRILRFRATTEQIKSARQNLRVSITRAKSMTTIMTSADDPCALLPS